MSPYKHLLFHSSVLCKIFVSHHTSCWVFLLILDVFPQKASTAPCQAVAKCSLSVDGCRYFGRRFFTLGLDIQRTSGGLWWVRSCQEPSESNSACQFLIQSLRCWGCLSNGSGLGFLFGIFWPYSTQLQLPSCSTEWVLPLDLSVHVPLFRLPLYQVFVVFKSVINVFAFA